MMTNKKQISRGKAIQRLLHGAVGILPTDTVYGIVARAQDPTAAERLYRIKHREGKPGTVIAASAEQLAELGISREHIAKVRHWWPNPLSIDMPLERGAKLDYLHQGLNRLACRVVADPELQVLLQQTGPLLTSSANQPGQPGAVTIADAQKYFGDEVDFYVDAGDLSGRPPSTIIGLNDDGSVIIYRQGGFRVT